jgi:hypothetical protein
MLAVYSNNTPILFESFSCLYKHLLTFIKQQRYVVIIL